MSAAEKLYLGLYEHIEPNGNPLLFPVRARLGHFFVVGTKKGLTEIWKGAQRQHVQELPAEYEESLRGYLGSETRKPWGISGTWNARMPAENSPIA